MLFNWSLMVSIGIGFLPIVTAAENKDEIPKEHYKDSTQILQILRDHLTQWATVV